MVVGFLQAGCAGYWLQTGCSYGLLVSWLYSGVLFINWLWWGIVGKLIGVLDC